VDRIIFVFFSLKLPADVVAALLSSFLIFYASISSSSEPERSVVISPSSLFFLFGVREILSRFGSPIPPLR